MIWQERIDAAAGDAEGLAIEPRWFEDGVPRCDDACRYHDGKRCQLLGLRAPSICEPAVAAMARVCAAHP